MSKVYRRLVNVYVNDENCDGPDVASITLDEEKIKRIRQLARAVKRLKAAYIEDWDYTALLGCKNGEFVGWSDSVTDETPIDEAALLVNDDNPVTAIRAKHRIAGDSIHSEETFKEIEAAVMSEWDGTSDCETLRVSHDDFHFSGNIKHTSVTWETEGIPLKDLPALN
jgi:predicted transcriptional regulator